MTAAMAEASASLGQDLAQASLAVMASGLVLAGGDFLAMSTLREAVTSLQDVDPGTPCGCKCGPGPIAEGTRGSAALLAKTLVRLELSPETSESRCGFLGAFPRLEIVNASKVAVAIGCGDDAALYSQRCMEWEVEADVLAKPVLSEPECICHEVRNLIALCGTGSQNSGCRSSWEGIVAKPESRTPYRLLPSFPMESLEKPGRYRVRLRAFLTMAILTDDEASFLECWKRCGVDTPIPRGRGVPTQVESTWMTIEVPRCRTIQIDWHDREWLKKLYLRQQAIDRGYQSSW